MSARFSLYTITFPTSGCKQAEADSADQQGDKHKYKQNIYIKHADKRLFLLIKSTGKNVKYKVANIKSPAFDTSSHFLCASRSGMRADDNRNVFLLAVQFNVNDGGGDLLHHISNEVVLVTETVRVLLT